MTPGPGAPAAFGVDVGGTKMLGVAVGRDGHVLAQARVATPHGATDPDRRTGAEVGAEVAAAVADLVDTLRSAVGDTAGPVPADLPTDLPPRLPVGLGVPGMLDARGILCFAPNLKGAQGADIRALVAERLPGVDVGVANDANCAALAELRQGALRGVDEGLVVTLGTGIGGGVVIGGTVRTGAHGFAGEVGHITVDPTGPLCPCGKRGCWERYASGAGLGRLAREAAAAGRLHHVVAMAGGEPEAVRGEHVTSAAHAGEPGALAVMEDLGWWVALGLANLTALLDPGCIVLGGGLGAAGEMLLAPARRAYAELLEGAAVRPQVPVVAAVLGEQAGAVGAAIAAAEGGLW